MLKKAVLLSVTLMSLHAAPASAVVLFSQDFQSAVPGQQLSTLGFTYAGTTNAVVQNTAPIGLAFDGRVGQGSNDTANVVGVRRTIPTAGANATKVEISMDIWAPTPNRNQSFQLMGNPSGDTRFADVTFGTSGFSSNLFSGGVYSSTYNFPGSSVLGAQKVNMKIVFDIQTNLLHTELTGPSYAMSSPTIAQPDGSEAFMNLIEIYNDLRGGVQAPDFGQGAIWDNLVVNATFVPEPSSLALLSLAGLAIKRVRRGSRNAA